MTKQLMNGKAGMSEPDSYQALDEQYLSLDRQEILRTRNIQRIPNEADRRGGKHAYAEWAHVIGIFQAMMFVHAPGRENNSILDVGCGTGLMAIASEPLLGEQGSYVGIDVMKDDVEFCRGHYPQDRYGFIHLDVNNPAYAPGQNGARSSWPVESDSKDLVTALSVWTHFGEHDAQFYFQEVARVLKSGGRAIITFFLLDELYEQSLATRTHVQGRYHRTMQDQWIFDQPAYGSDAWFYPAGAPTPESATGVSRAGLDRLMAAAGLKLVEFYPGNWKERPGMFFQDILVFEKP